MGCQQSLVAISHGGVEEIRQEAHATSPAPTLLIGRCASRRRQDKRAAPREPTPGGARPDFDVVLEKQPSDKLGVSLGTTPEGAVIYRMKADGLLQQYNADASEERKLRAGFIIVDVNGKRGYWDIFEELRKGGRLNMVISPTPPKGSSTNWFEEIESVGRDLEAHGHTFFVVRWPPHEPNADTQKSLFSSLPTVRTGDVSVDQCAICLGDVGPDGLLVQLQCGHAFHLTCAGRWMTEKGRHAQGKKQCCPLCCRRMVAEPGAAEPDQQAALAERA